jgi:hypothetical protein
MLCPLDIYHMHMARNRRQRTSLLESDILLRSFVNKMLGAVQPSNWPCPLPDAVPHSQAHTLAWSLFPPLDPRALARDLALEAEALDSVVEAGRRKTGSRSLVESKLPFAGVDG